jgi:hypothetical protein
MGALCEDDEEDEDQVVVEDLVVESKRMRCLEGERRYRMPVKYGRASLGDVPRCRLLPKRLR